MIRALVRHDMRLQFRNGFHAAYLFVVVSYVVLLRLIPPDLRAGVIAPVLLSEASVVGFFFAGALLHFERGDGSLHALAITPVRTVEYLAARCISLSVLNTLVAVAVAAGAGVPRLAVPLLVLAAALTAFFFTLLGTAVACRFAGIDRFVVLGGLASAVLGLVVFPFYGVVESPLWRVVPTDASLRLLAAATGGPVPGAGRLALTAVLLAGWSAAAALLAGRWLDAHALGRSSARAAGPG